MSLAGVHRLLQGFGARRLLPGCPVYELRRPLWPPLFRTLELHKRQLEILETIRALPWKIYLHGPEDPSEWELPGPWVDAEPRTWALPPAVATQALLEGPLGCGAWQVYLGAHALAPDLLPDLFRGDLLEAVSFSESHSIPLLVDAWHDNSEWRVLLQPSAVPGLVAA